MIIKDQELRQMDEAYLRPLKETDPEALLALSLKLVADLKKARERLNQTSVNSSKPSGSFALWEKGGAREDDDELSDEAVFPKTCLEAPTAQSFDSDKAEESDDSKALAGCAGNEPQPPKPRKPGRQEGSQGFGRTQILPITSTVSHRPDRCMVCSYDLEPYMGLAYTGFYTVDVQLGETESPGLVLTNTHHLYYSTPCPRCGLDNQAAPKRAENDPAWDQVGLTEWRLVGPGLASLILYLSFDLRINRRKLQRFLDDVFGLKLCVGTLQNVVIESARALEPVEAQLIDELLDESLIHADETSHGEAGELLWLWGFIGASTALFFIGHRTLEMMTNLLESEPVRFKGYLMSDGYSVYRHFKNRLRCWAHLIRKARALCDCYTPESRQYGEQMLGLLYEMMAGIRAARDGPDCGKVDISAHYQSQLKPLRILCERMKASTHEKTAALGGEFLNDWEAIFRILEHPEWPLTNNEAERALRHWVILRRITQGTRSAQGSRALGLIASIMETCRLRKTSFLHYAREVIVARRQGLEAPKLPHPGVSNSVEWVGV